MRYVGGGSSVARLVARLEGARWEPEDDLCAALDLGASELGAAVDEARSLGYGIESGAGSFRMSGATQKLLPWELGRGLQTRAIGGHIEYFESIASTQERAQELARSGSGDGSVIVAGTQTAGRGRRSRRWHSPAGGVWMSVVIRSCFETDVAGTAPLAAASALCDAVYDVLGIRTSLVWPNDLVVWRDGAERKVAGIIVDADSGSDGIGRMVFGVGVNFCIDEQSANAQIRDGPVRPAASLVFDPGVSPKKTIQEFLRNLESSCCGPSPDNAGIVKEWSRRSAQIGRNVSVRTGDATVTGIALRVDPDGALVVDDGRAEVRLVSAEAVRAA